jgi:hypothetical protein
MIELADQQVLVFLKTLALRDIDMDVNRSLATQGDLAQLISEPRTLSGDDIRNGRLAQRV